MASQDGCPTLFAAASLAIFSYTACIRLGAPVVPGRANGALINAFRDCDSFDMIFFSGRQILQFKSPCSPQLRLQPRSITTGSTEHRLMYLLMWRYQSSPRGNGKERTGSINVQWFFMMELSAMGGGGPGFKNESDGASIRLRNGGWVPLRIPSMLVQLGAPCAPLNWWSVTRAGPRR
jgi:hypothetical protein